MFQVIEDRATMLADQDARSTKDGSARVGSELRAARERLGWSLADVAGWLRIRRPYLEALEEGRIGDLPGRAYAVGFLRTYAAALGLEAEDLARRMKIEAAVVHKTAELSFPAPVPERGLPAGAVLLVGIILAIGAYVGWYRLSGEGRLPAEAVMPVPERLAPLAQQAVPPSASLLNPPAAPAIAPSAPGERLGSPGFPPSSAAAMPLPPIPFVPAAPGAEPAQAPAQPAPPPADATQITVRARADSWIQVREKAGKILVNRVLHPGDTWVVPASATPLLLTTGNAGGTELLLGGTLAPAIAGAGAVRRDLPLDPDTIRAGRLGVAPPVTPVAAPAPATAAPR